MRLISALLAEQNEIWQERRYLDIAEFAECAAARAAAGNGNNEQSLDSASYRAESKAQCRCTIKSIPWMDISERGSINNSGIIR